MSIESLKSNIKQEKQIAEKIHRWILMFPNSDVEQKKALQNAVISGANQMKILNDSLPEIVGSISMIKKLPEEPAKKTKDSGNSKLVNVSKPGSENSVTIKKINKNEYLKSLHISEVSMKNLKKPGKPLEESKDQYKKPSAYVGVANKFFLDFSNRLVDKGHFKSLKLSLRKSNSMFLTSSYLSVMLFTSLISLFISIGLFLFLFLFSISISAPYLAFVDLSSINILMRALQFIWVIPFIPIVIFLGMYAYPSTEKSTLEHQIEYELPFVTIQMSAIAGANLEPSNIFRIVALSKEYVYVRKEAKKILNQINFYGYDLVGALRNTAMNSPSKNWADLLNGIAMTIRSGGDLAKFLSKRAETLLFEYRLKREKATRAAETFMNIYISVVIAAPMLMMILFVIMSASNMMPLSIIAITLIVVSVVMMINVVFLMFLQMNQKKF